MEKKALLRHSVNSLPFLFKVLSCIVIIMLFLSFVSKKEFSILSLLEFLSNFDETNILNPFSDFVNNFLHNIPIVGNLFNIPVLGSLLGFVEFVLTGLQYCVQFITSFIFFLF